MLKELLKFDFWNRSSSENPYEKEGFPLPPLPWMKSRLIRRTAEEPGKAFIFIQYLMENHPLYRNLAMHLTHAAVAATWTENKFNADSLKTIPQIDDNYPDLIPPDIWYDQLEKTRKELAAYQRERNIGLRVQYYQRFHKEFDLLENLSLDNASNGWNRYYRNALKRWRQQVEEEHKKLKLLAKEEEPVALNVYKDDGFLTPEDNRKVFIDREDAMLQLGEKILSSPNMPIFLLQGQRRSGKTSLLKFLPFILDSRFKLVYLDLKPLASIPEWLEQIRVEFDKTMDITEEQYPFVEGRSWVDTWKFLTEYMEIYTEDRDIKVILAFDDYESVHRHFRDRPEAGESFLSALRGFSQQQDKIALLFAGAALFSDLKDPYWSNSLVQAIRVKMDYLDKEETFELIDLATLDYHSQVKEAIYELTMGHPALVQRICLQMVHLANSRRRPEITMPDLEKVLKEHIYIPENGIVELFWHQFCGEPGMKQTVLQIIEGQPPTDPKAMFRLQQHGFVVKGIHSFQMRVPIFGEWVRQFGK